MASAKLEISSFPDSFSSRQIVEIFKKYGRIITQDVSQGEGLVEFERIDQAQNAKEDLNGKEFEGRKVRVSYYKDYHSPQQQYRGKYDRKDVHSSGRGGSRNGDYRDNRENYHNQRFQRNDKCYVCHGFGHWATNCPKGDGSAVASGKCFNCGERGHIAKKCPNRKQSRSRSPIYDKKEKYKYNSNSRSGSRSYSRSGSSSRSYSSYSKSSRSQSKSKHKSQPVLKQRAEQINQ